jgi:hypothetical protein
MGTAGRKDVDYAVLALVRAVGLSFDDNRNPCVAMHRL